MPYSEPTNLAVVACPGGESFADEVITHLHHMYKHRFNSKTDVLSNRYQITKDQVVKYTNFLNDMKTTDLCVRGNTEKYRVPTLKLIPNSPIL